MKTSKLKFIFLFIFCVIVGVVLVGCNVGINKKLRDCIAEIREFVLFGRDEDLSATLTCGKRESDYKINGEATPLVDFGVLTFSNGEFVGKKITDAQFVLFVGTKKYDGVLTQNPFDDTLVADIKTIIDPSENVLATVILEGSTRNIKLKRVDEDWTIKPIDCIEILSKNYKDKLKTMIKNKKFCGELYIKILNDNDNIANDFYYYISVVSIDGKNINMIISPKTKEILASSTNIP